MTDSKELKERGLKVTTARIQILEIFQAIKPAGLPMASALL